MLNVNRILKLYFILSENKKRNYYYYYYYYYIPTDEKDYRKCSFIVYFAQSQKLERVDQHTANSINIVYLLGYIQCS